MTVIIDPRTGALVSDLREKVQVDALVRVFTRWSRASSTRASAPTCSRP